MTEHSTIENPDTRSPQSSTRWPARLAVGRWTLIATAGVMLALLALQRLSIVEAVIGFVIIAFAAMIMPSRTRQARLTAEAVQSGDQALEAGMASFADTLPMPCIVVDERAWVLHLNAHAARQFPKLGRAMPVSFSLRHPALLSAIDACRKTRSPQTVDMHISVPNETWYQVAVAPLTIAAGRHNRGREWIVITMTDITEQRRIDRLRADFVANASHELRTPLTSLIGFIETLQGPAARDAEAREKFLGIMRAQAERMSNLINDLMSLSRIESHRHVPPTDTVNLKTLLHEVAEGMQPQAKNAGIMLELDLPQTDAKVTGERNELYEVFENLIDNAIKYGGEGKTVDLVLKPSDRPGLAYSVTVTDHGAGIGGEHVPRLTERFYRVDAESSRQKKGTGLGLAIVKHIVNRHRGLMTIRSTPGTGTSVEILLPA